MNLERKHKKLHHFNHYTSASAIAREHGLSVPTILRRYAAGLRDHDLVARAYQVPDVPGGVSVHRSERFPSLGEARYRLRRAERGLDMAQQRLSNARALGENRNVVLRLAKALHRAEVRRMYATEMVRVTENLSRGEAA